MLLLNKYYLRQFLPTSIVSVSLFTFLLFLDKLFSLSHLLIVKNVELLQLIKLSTVVLLTLLPLTVPIGLLLSTVLIFSRAAENNELLAVRSSGINLIRLLLPFWSIYSLFSLIAIVFNFYISPHFHKLYKKMHMEIVLRNPWVKIEPRKFSTLHEYSIFAFNVKRNTIEGINIYKLNDSGEPVACITAKKAKYLKATPQQIILVLYDGEIHNLVPSEINVLSFKRYVLSLPMAKTPNNNISEGALPSSLKSSLKELTYNELLVELRKRKKENISSIILTECFLRLNLALSCFTLPFLGLPLGIRLKKEDKITGLSLTIVITIIFYILFVLGITLGEKSTVVSPQVAVSLPNIVGIICGVAANMDLLRK